MIHSKTGFKVLCGDGKPRIEYLLQKLFHTSAGEEGSLREQYVKWASAYAIRGAVQRTFEPGSALPTMLILQGVKNIGKSTMFKSLLPPQFRGLYTEDVSFSMKEDKLRDLVVGKAIVEFSELRGMYAQKAQNINAADPKEVTAFISKTSVDYRRVYERKAKSHPRSFVIVATTNSELPLPEYTDGDRRYAAIRIGQRMMKKEDFAAYFTTKRIGNLWAEAMHEWKTREIGQYPALLPESLWEYVQEGNEEFRYVNEQMQERLDYAAEAVKRSTQKYWTYRQILTQMQDAEGCEKISPAKGVVISEMRKRGYIL